MDTKYPHVTVQLSGADGNVFSIIGKVAGALRRQISPEAAKEFSGAALDCCSYDKVLRLAMTTVNVE